jgi:hypothetical protein
MRQKPDSTSLPSTAELDPSHVMEIGTGFWPSKTLLSAVELDLFSLLGAESMLGEEVRPAVPGRPRNAETTSSFPR